jgi:hypothetical protein
VAPATPAPTAPGGQASAPNSYKPPALGLLGPVAQNPVVSGTLNGLQRPLSAVQQILNHLFR